MRSPIESARAKLRWSYIHLQAFDAALTAWRSESHLVTITLKPNPKAGEHAWVGIPKVVPSVPDRFALIAGDLVHNLRGALDHITWVLADRESPGRGDDHQTQFPIITDPNRWGRHPMTRWTNYLSDDDRWLLERLQPFHTASPAEDHPLAWLEALSNRDKHREINAVAAAPEFLLATFTPMRDCVIKDFATVSGALVVGTPALSVTIEPTGPDPHVKVDSAFTPAVAISEAERSGLAHYVLPNLHHSVAQVVRLFEQILVRRP